MEILYKSRVVLQQGAVLEDFKSNSKTLESEVPVKCHKIKHRPACNNKTDKNIPT